MPFDVKAISVIRTCGPGPDGRRYAWCQIRIPAAELRRLGLHPSQPTAAVTTPTPPGWWHAAAERRF